MNNSDDAKTFKVTIAQGDHWCAHLDNGGEVASADSLAELRQQVINTAASLLTVRPDDRVVIEWTYSRPDGKADVEKQEITRATAAPNQASARLAWNQRRVDEYLEQLRTSRQRPD
ncbi:MAG: hypothetical protein NTV23_03185 [Propionibacteriales bacterium]|nr:hypothetical protein [Propionibacteriales bacterium]